MMKVMERKRRWWVRRGMRMRKNFMVERVWIWGWRGFGCGGLVVSELVCAVKGRTVELWFGFWLTD